ncbi:MAG TPA: F0F1 ATP synthase subunit A [Candidatus Aminicenantes bacterium]|nr:F0F1 ATP synthase subunit A [Candidatus Aminicenantes bacterium]
MEGLEHSLWLVEAFNRVFGPPVAAFLGLFGLEVDPLHAVPDYLVMVLVVAVAVPVLLRLLARRPALVPGRRQTVAEMVVQAFESVVVDAVGPEGRKYVPVIGTVGIFIFACNMIGLIPGFMSPTSKLNVTLGCALVVFLYYHAQGVRSQGLKYFKHFVGDIPALAPLMLPIEIISHFSRPVSLSMRLFCNIFAEELLIVIMASIIPFLLPLPFMAVAIFTSVIQAYVFVLLACIYIAGAVAHQEEHST